jgi:ABC-2 type transport system permease protein
MGNIVAVFQKEMRSYFGSPIAYVVAGVFLLFMGFIFRNLVLNFNQISLTYMQSAQGPRGNLNVNDVVVRSFFALQFFIWMIVTPMLTMRLYSEEFKTGTIELLMTSPLTTWQTLLGKFSASLTMYLMIEFAAFMLLGMLSFYAEIDWGPVIAAYVAILLLGGTFISAGVFASSLTDNQIVAAVVSFFLLMLLWMIDWASHFTNEMLAALFRHLSILDHMQDMSRGVVDTMDIVFFLSAILFFLFLTHTVLESRNWRK